MNEKQAKRLGKVLRQRREHLGLSSRALAKLAGLPDSTIVRLEQGLFLQPRPEKLGALANALGLEQTEVFRLASYEALSELPAPRAYFRMKFRDLPTRRVESIGREVEEVLARHGIELSEGPALGEDEAEGDIIRTKSKRRGGKK